MSQLSPIQVGDPAAGPMSPEHTPLPRRPGSALALRNWRVRWRLIALIAIPTVVGLFFAGLRVDVSAATADTFSHVQRLAQLGQQVTGLAQAVEDERDLTAAYIARGRPPDGLAALRGQYAVTGHWAARVTALATRLGGGYPGQTHVNVTAVLDRVNSLPELRVNAVDGATPAITVITDYSAAVGDLFALNDDIAQQGGDAQLVTGVRTLGSLSRMKDQASQQRAILELALIKGQFGPGTLAALTSAGAQQASDLAAFGASATLSQSQAFTDTVAGPQVDQGQTLEQRALVLGPSGGTLNLGPGAAAQWYQDMSYTIGRMRLLERHMSDAILRRAQSLRAAAVRTAVLTGGAALVLLVAVLLITLLIATSLVGPLRRLEAGALDVAEVRLAAEVRDLAEPGQSGLPEIQPIDVHSSDEIGRVARAFDRVHREAVRLAAEEATLRGSVSAMFVSLSRRSQSLLERLLRLIDTLELGEEDAERLANLFRVDHLATRLRRNSENLLVLAGHEAPRRWAEPVALTDVLRAACSEIEQYERVALKTQPGVAIVGSAVADAVHLLAELLENATMFSAKTTKVVVSGQALTTGGALVDIRDAGMGMTEAQLAQVNLRLDQPPVADVAVSRHMGLFAVAHLAARHGIKVRLRLLPEGGVGAQAWFPDELISQRSSPAPWERRPGAAARVPAMRFPRFSPDQQGSPVPFLPGPLAPAASRSRRALSVAGDTTGPLPTMARGALGAPPVTVDAPGQAAPGQAAPGQAAPGQAAPGQSTGLPIYDSIESDWFRVRGRGAPRARVERTAAASAVAASAVAGSAVGGSAVGGSAVAGSAVAGSAVAGSAVAGSAVGGSAVGAAAAAAGSPAGGSQEAAASWTSPGDEGWRRASAALKPAIGGTTSAGLPRRVPQANLIPGSAGNRGTGAAKLADAAEIARTRLAGFQRGSRRARAGLAASGPSAPSGDAG
jgi:HAMP domain-containing protein